jgi:Tol biopolymer transport system component
MFLFFALRRGYKILQEGNHPAALAYFNDLRQRYPSAPEPLFEISKLKFKAGDVAGAREDLLGVLDRSPGKDILAGILELTNWWMLSSPNFFNTTPTFSPDGSQLLFCSARQDTNGDGKIDNTDRAGICVADIATGVVTELVSAEHHNASPVWAPDGRSFLYLSSRVFTGDPHASKDTGNRQLLRRHLDGQADELLVPASLNPRYPVFTPDGKKVIVCTVDSIGGPSGLSVIDLETQIRRSITSHAFEHTFPQVSPDGKWLMYISWRGPGASRLRPALDSNPAIYLMDLEMEKERLLVDATWSNAYPRFSPQSDSIVFLSRRHDTNFDTKINHLDNFGIYTLRLSDRKETYVGSDDHSNKFPVFSPDGKSILFIGHWADRRQPLPLTTDEYFEFKGLYRIPASGGAPKTVVCDKYYGSRFCEVSPRGSLVAYVSWRPRTHRGLYVADYEKQPSLDQLRGFITNNLS